jgi:dienelactone hydrolase
MANNTKKTGHKRTGWIVLISLVLLLIISSAVYISIYYHADETALRYMQSDENVTVSATEYGWLFDGPSEDTALIFYPGAKVEEKAYAPLLHSLADQGIDVCLVSMPFRLACLDGNAATKVLDSHSYSRWYIGGHSLGGFMASEYAAGNANDLSGVILLGAYPMKKVPDQFTEILIVGSEDKVVNWNKIEKGREYAPANYIEYVINGGNHAQFGSYGKQRVDGTAQIPADEQVKETVKIIVDAIG